MAKEESPAVRTLEELVAAMRGLLGVVDTADEDEETLLSAWNRCQVLLDHVRAQAADVHAHSPEERAEIQERLQTAVRLNAIATHLVQRESARVTEQLRVLRDARRKLRSQIARSTDSGSSVDLAG